MKDKEFKEGQKLSAVWWNNGEDGYSVQMHCTAITVVMEYGQMAAVPWAYCEFAGKPPRKLNLALMEEVVLEKPCEEQ